MSSKLVEWRRYKYWAAHAFVRGEQLCNTAHGTYMSFAGPRTMPALAELMPSGLPYGKVCTRCRRELGLR